MGNWTMVGVGRDLEIFVGTGCTRAGKYDSPKKFDRDEWEFLQIWERSSLVQFLKLHPILKIFDIRLLKNLWICLTLKLSLGKAYETGIMEENGRSAGEISVELEAKDFVNTSEFPLEVDIIPSSGITKEKMFWEIFRTLEEFTGTKKPNFQQKFPKYDEEYYICSNYL